MLTTCRGRPVAVSHLLVEITGAMDPGGPLLISFQQNAVVSAAGIKKRGNDYIKASSYGHADCILIVALS